MAVKKTQMYRKNLDTSETNLYPLTEAQYVSMENGQTVQEILSDRDSDKYTPVITNSSSTFKVGQGDNVDLSSSMKEGAYDSCVLKGKTMVNCIQEPSSKDVVLPYEFADGQYVTINDTKESGALGVELKGQTLVNIHKLTTPSLAAHATGWYENLVTNSGEIGFDVLTSPEGWRYINAGKLNYQMLKPNTKYLVVFESSQNISSIHFMRGDGLNGLAPSTVPVQNSKAIITTNSQIVANEQILYVNFRAEPNTKVSFKNPMIIEYVEGMENWDIPYIEGMTSCKMPTLHTVGKNLFDLSNASNGYLSTNAPYVLQSPDYNNKTSAYIKVKPNTKYSYSFDGFTPSQVGNMYWTGFYYYKRIGEVSTVHPSRMTFTSNSEANKQLTFTTPSDCNYIRIGSRGLMLSGATVQLEEATSATAYEPYKSSILSLPEEVFLRDVNGVKDTFNTKTGIYTQRTKTLAINGTESWREMTQVCTEESKLYEISNGLVGAGATGNTGRITMISDKYVVHTGDRLWNDPSLRGVAQNGNRFRIRVSSNDFPTVDSLTQFLQVNPITVQYELATPIITKINLPSTLKSWNATTHIYSEIPENTLYPTLSHSNPSYPVILKPSTKYSIVANSYSNNHTNSAINFNLGGATASTTVGNRVTTVTTPSTLSNELLTMSGRGNKLNNVMVIEGDVVGDEPYFEGICDCKSPILSNIGETILETPFEKEFGTDAQKEFFRIVDCAEIFDNFGVGKQYTLSLDIKANKSGAARIYLQNGSGSRHNFSFDIPVTTEYVRHTKQITPTVAGDGHNFKESWLACFTTYNTGCFATIKNIRISTGEDEPYKSNILSCETYFDETTQSDKTIALRSLPSGVCDTLNVGTGEYVQNVVDVVLDGTENWTLNNWGTDDNFCSFEISSLNNAKIQNVYKQNSYIKFYCDTFRVLTNCAWNYMGEKHIRQWSDGNRTTISVIIPKTELKTYNVAGFIEYLTKNNIRINIRANNPIVSTVDIQGFPYAYANGHVQLSSGSIEQSLTPKVEYSLSANKTGQIDNNTRQVVRQQNKLDDFEAMMLTAMVQSAYDKAILQFDYEMQMMSLGGE